MGCQNDPIDNPVFTEKKLITQNSDGTKNAITTSSASYSSSLPHFLKLHMASKRKYIVHQRNVIGQIQYLSLATLSPLFFCGGCKRTFRTDWSKYIPNLLRCAIPSTRDEKADYLPAGRQGWIYTQKLIYKPEFLRYTINLHSQYIDVLEKMGIPDDILNSWSEGGK